MTYAYRVSPNFKRVLQKKPKEMREAVKQCILRLSENPRHPGLNTHKMKGLRSKDQVWEAYVDAGNRVTFHYELVGKKTIIVLRNNCNHDMLTRNP
ncbi:MULTISPECIES: hypothetical protein [Microbacterium]|uniref:hypothetical protein n=1 Tax=Microbacterium TaxID=33882 RepID=UPI001C2C6BF9|nr:hypothetical protein [Microbacterium paraoxydans]QXE28955.1 hypothetical protein IZR02_11195 [Microbacterium paraoxydans]